MLPKTALLISLQCALVYLAVSFVAWRISARFMFRPPELRRGTARASIYFLHGFHKERVAVTYAHNPAAKYTILHSHGNAEDLGGVLGSTVPDFAAHGYSVIAYDYPGYGLSTGTPTEAGAIRACEDVYEHACTTLNIRPEDIILHGRSLGSGVATQIARKHAVAGVVLESAFTSIIRVLTTYKLFPFDHFDNAAAMSKLPKHLPLLIIHGELDKVVPISHGEALFAAASSSEKRHAWIPGAGHNDVAVIGGDAYWGVLARFCASLR